MLSKISEGLHVSHRNSMEHHCRCERHQDVIFANEVCRECLATTTSNLTVTMLSDRDFYPDSDSVASLTVTMAYVTLGLAVDRQ